jgi:predicted alpha/beta-hydrolase family hydrolase
MTSRSSVRQLHLPVDAIQAFVSAVAVTPPDPRWGYVLAHGAGAGMRHRFMEAIAGQLAERGVATIRYQFPYMEEGRKRPDAPMILHATVRAAVRMAAEALPTLPLVAGGKSMGGRMTSQAQAQDALPGIRGLVFLGFPLHAPNKPDDRRATHLADVNIPMLFLQGTRDSLADLSLLTPVCQRLAPQATLHVVEGGDHSFKVLKRSGRTDEEVLGELAETMVHWLARLG